MNRNSAVLFAFISTFAVRGLLCLLTLLCSLGSTSAHAEEYYKSFIGNGVSPSDGLGGGAYAFPLSERDGVELCEVAVPWVYPNTISEVTTYNHPTGGGPWVRFKCSNSTNPSYYFRYVERPLVGLCPTGTHPYAEYGYHSDGGKRNYAIWLSTPELVTPAFWCVAPCKAGETSFGGLCLRDKNLGGTCPATKNPISIGLGNKFLRETDYVGSGPFPLAFRRYYNSRAIARYYERSSIDPWRHEYQRRVESLVNWQNVSVLTVYRPDGRTSMFGETGGAIVSQDADTKDVLERLTDAGGALTGWRFKASKTEEVELYDAQGNLLSITNRAGATQTLTYSTDSTPVSIAPRRDLLIQVTDPFGRALHFTYDSISRMVSMTDPSGGVYTYAYAYPGNPVLVTSVTYPDTRSKLYGYDEASLVQGGAFGLSSIVGEDGVLFATYEYAAQGRAIAETIGGIERTTLAYGPTGTTVTDALNTARNYAFQDILGTTRVTGQSQPGGAGCGPAAQGMGYDVNGNVTSTTDFNGIQTTYVFDLARNLETSRTEAAGTPKARTITTQWHSTYRLPTQIDEPGKRTTYTRDASGNVMSYTVLDTTASLSRTTTYTYNSVGQVLTIDGPRTDINDVTTFTYNQCTSGYECGQVQSIRDALGHVTTFNTYNAHGQPLTITDANGVLTTLVYDARQRLTSRSVAGEITNFYYYPTGLLQQVAMPDGSFLNYVYNAAHRLTEIDDGLGNRMVYTLDAMGNRTSEKVYDPSGALTRTHSAVFDGLSRLFQDFTASGSLAQATGYGYDANGNPTTVSAPLSRNSSNAFDELSRLKQVTDANNGVTQYGYNPLDQLVSVTDPRNLQTTYTYNALGDLTQQVSPDTGTTINTFDSSGNLKTTTDARNKTATYTYDALNRVTQVIYPDQTLIYTYDAGANAAGKISSVTDSSGSTSWTYTPQGRIATKTQVMGAMVKTVQYGYNAAGQLITTTTPSGKTISYGYANNQITNVTVNSVNLLNSVLYEPFGPTSGWTWGNGTLAVRAYDTDGKLTQIDSAGFKTIGYDDAQRITSITDNDNGINSWSYGYDTLDRLTSAIGVQTQSFTFDADGNRLTQGGTTSSTLTVSPTNNRLNSVSGALSRTYNYDNAGNTTSDGSITYAYNDMGRMISATKAGITTTYSYNALGQRVTKTTAGITTYFVYDESGHLLGEYDNTGSLIEEIAWMDDTPVASIRFGSCGLAVFYIHTDHLNTPRRITKRSTNGVVWRWESDPFGTTMANENPSGAGTFAFNLRFPGQYLDQESGLHYNYFRYYNPSTGRYVESDPIGLDGGVNTYAYVASDPIAFNDPYGLFSASDLPMIPAPSYNFLLGLADSVSLNLGPLARDALGIDAGIDRCSTSYQFGGYAGDAVSLLGGGGLIGKSLLKRAGTEFSHAIPGRYVRQFSKRGRVNSDYKAWLDNPLGRAIVNSRLNGNYVSQMEHRMSDIMRQFPGLTNADPRWSFLRQQLNRFPGWIPGTVFAAHGLGGLTDCECN